MKTSQMIWLAVGAFLLYEMSKTNNPAGLFSSLGLGRVYLSGMGQNGMSGLGTIGQGYNINEQHAGDASRYEQAAKFTM